MHNHNWYALHMQEWLVLNVTNMLRLQFAFSFVINSTCFLMFIHIIPCCRFNLLTCVHLNIPVGAVIQAFLPLWLVFSSHYFKLHMSNYTQKTLCLNNLWVFLKLYCLYQWMRIFSGHAYYNEVHQKFSIF